MRRVLTGASLAVLASFAALATTSPAAAQEKTLRIASNILPAGQGHVHNGVGIVNAPTIQAFFDSLTYVDGKGEVVPGLATSWEAVGRDKWVIKLRPNVVFHNGERMNAATVLANVAWMTSDAGKASAAMRTVLGSVAGARAVDDLTVEIATHKPEPLFARLGMDFRLFEAKAWNDLGAAAFAKAPVGTGAFKVTDWTAERVRGDAHRQGWRPPKVDRLEITVLPEPAARVQALLSNQLDVAFDVPLDDQAKIEGAGSKIYVVRYPAVVAMALRTTVDGPLTDRRVRQALNHGINKEAYIASMMHGMTSAASQPAASNVFGHQSDIKPYAYDPAKAKALLAEAGHPNGLKLKGEVVVSRAEYTGLFQIVSANLQQAGIDLTLTPIALPELVKKVQGATPWGDTVIRSSPYNAYPSIDPIIGINGVHSCKSQSYWTCDQQIEPVIQAANEEFDPAKRAALVKQIMHRYHDQAWGIFLHDEVLLDGVASRVRNYRSVNLVIDYHAVELQ